MRVEIESVERRKLSGIKNGREWAMDDTYLGYLVPDSGVNFTGARPVSYQFGTSENFDKLPPAPFVADIELGTGFDMRGDPVQIIVKCTPVISTAAVNQQK